MFAVFSKDLRRLELLYVITSIGIPLLFDWIPFVNGLYGVAGAWCWIKNWKGDCANDKMLLGTIEQYMFLYAPGMALLFIDLLMIIVTIGVLLYRSYCRPVKEAAEYDPLLERQTETEESIQGDPSIDVISNHIHDPLPPFTNSEDLWSNCTRNRIFSVCITCSNGPSWGLLVGVIVMIHVFILKCCSSPLNQKPQAAVSSFDHRVMEDNPVYTVDTVASTDAKT